jgi:lipopolysaccharide/colanic/teichoic acid biosynthesis glycosyltransferase
LTDPATIKYCHEQEHLSRAADQRLFYKTVVIPDKIRLSVGYLEEANLLKDLVILAQTARALLPVRRIPQSAETHLTEEAQ